MNIELSKETEALVAAAIAKGGFESVEAYLATVTSEFLKKSVPPIQESPADSDELDSDAKEERKRSWEEFEKPIDLDELARQQGIGPIQDSSSLRFDDWPEDDPLKTSCSGQRASMSQLAQVAFNEQGCRGY